MAEFRNTGASSTETAGMRAQRRVEVERTAAGGASMFDGAADDRSVVDLVRELAQEGSTLVREEVALAKAEMREKLSVYERNAAAIAVGAGLLLAALLLAVAALNRGLTALLELAVGVGVAVWLAPLLLAGVTFAVGYGMVRRGIAGIGDEGLAPKRTIASVREDKEWVQRKVAS